MKNRIKATKKRPITAIMSNGLVQHITVEESTRIQWFNGDVFSANAVLVKSSSANRILNLQ